jgi:hypothetical protein
MLPIAATTSIHDVTTIKQRTYMIERAGDSPPFWTTEITIETAAGVSHVVTIYHTEEETDEKRN